MNDYASSQLRLWSEWLLKKDTGATGYPKQCVYTKLVQIRGGAGYNPEFDTNALLVDKFMTELSKHDRLGFDIVSMCYCIKWVDVGHGVLKATYTMNSNQESVGKALNVAQYKVSRDLNRISNSLIDYLLDQ